MAAEEIFRDTVDVYKALFNHRGPIRREVNFYVQEFETKCKDRELSRLNQACVHTSHIENILPDVESLAKQHVQSVFDEAQNAIEKANAILNNKLPEEDVEKVDERRTRMENDWKRFEDETNTKREEAERKHIENMEKLKAEIKRLDAEIKSK